MSGSFASRKMRGLIRFRRGTDAIDPSNPPSIAKSSVVLTREYVNDKEFIALACPVCGNGILVDLKDIEKFILGKTKVIIDKKELAEIEEKAWKYDECSK